MRRLLITITAIVLGLLFAAPANAERAANPCKPIATIFDEVALNGAAALRTKTVSGLQGYDKLRLSVQFTHANNGTLTFLVTSLAAGSTTVYEKPTSLSCSAGTCTVTIPASGLSFVTASLSADQDFPLYIDLHADTKLKIVATHGGAPAAGDKLTVTGFACVGGG